MKCNVFLPLFAAISIGAAAADSNSGALMTAVPDTMRTIDVEEAVVVASPKLSGKLRSGDASVSLLGEDEMRAHGVRSLADVSAYAPNLFVPSYGSLQSSAMYIRGVGSRINTPAVALYVDNVPVITQSGYNFRLLDVNRIDVLRGPQGCLFGRNAMGGVLHLHTTDPFAHQGGDVRTGISSRDGGGYVSASLHERLSDKVAMTAGGFYEGTSGIFRNDTLNKRVGGSNRFGGRLGFHYRPADRWRLGLTASYDYSDEDAYPYFYGGMADATEEQQPNLLGKITANRDNSYRRHLLNGAFTAQYDAGAFTLSSVTGYQFLNDRMMMDQDFLSIDYYTLEQRQKSHALTEEIVLKGKPGKRIDWTAGAFGMWQNMRTKAPVVFYGDGMAMLNGSIAGNMPTIQYPNPYSGQPVAMPLNLAITDEGMSVLSRFRMPVVSGAVFAQGTLHDVFADGLDLTLGLRLDSEHQKLTYVSGVPQVNYNFSMPMIAPANLVSDVLKQGNFKDNYTRLLPKASILYNLPEGRGNVYATVSEGMRAGGYNVQMFSEVMSGVMRADMMNGTRDYCNELLQGLADNASSPQLAAMFSGIKQTMNDKMPAVPEADIRSTVTYQPEYCWNYELGSHLNLLDGSLMADFSVFFMDTHNQQLSRFASTGLGRMMVNAGRSYSCGLEMALRGNVMNDRLHWNVSYGYTHAEFRRCDLGGGQDYRGNHVPFIPEHNVGVMADYTLPLSSSFLKNITFGADMTGLGRIYWTEANNIYQDFYVIPGAHCLLDFGAISLNVWGKNLSQTKYHAFEFESMNHNFYQKGNPLQVGVDLRWCF